MPTAQRSYNMSRIRGKDTKPEMIVRRYLWAHGFRYRLNHKRLPGKPDVVLRKYRTCIFVNGCFWHGHNVAFGEVKELNSERIEEMKDSECCKIPHTNREFWIKKIMRNKERDIQVQKELAEMGWHCITVWECSLSSNPSATGEGKKTMREQTLESLAYTLTKIYLQDHVVHHTTKRYTMPDEKEYAMVAEECHRE